ncbi:MAG: hypothetical protein DME19_19975 [Verrucomicrobia bacterium]|nr:MAG: hypothetical protein DME19_19975 [Verrucomicrobiota bacterium]
MSKSRGILKAIGYSFGAAIAASFIVLLVGLCVFGFQFSQWPEWEGRIVGAAGTIGGVAGAVVGLRLAFRAERRVVK